MNATLLESHIAAATAALGKSRTPADGWRNGSQNTQKDGSASWQADYGTRNETTAKAALDASGLSHGISGGSHGASSASGKNRLDHGGGWSAKTLWRAINANLCNGTKVLAICAGVTAFIVVI